MPALTIGLIGGGLALAGGGISAFGASKSKSPSYKPRDLARPNLNQYFGTLPSVFELQQMVTNQYGGLNQNSASDALFGTQDRNMVATYYQAGRRTKNPRTLEYVQPGREGLIGQMANAQPQISALQQAYRDAQASGMKGLIDQYGGDRSYFERSKPGIASLQKYAHEELARGGQLNPSIRREVEQSTRQGQSARGMGYGTNDAFQEAMEIGMAAEERKRSRERFALGADELAGRNYVDPMLPFLTPNSGEMGVAGNLLAQAYQQSSQASAGPGFINPYGQWGANSPANNSTANALSAFGGGLGGLGGGMIGGAIGMGGGQGGSGGGGNWSPGQTFDVNAYAGSPSYASGAGVRY